MLLVVFYSMHDKEWEAEHTFVDQAPFCSNTMVSTQLGNWVSSWNSVQKDGLKDEIDDEIMMSEPNLLADSSVE